MKRSIMSIFAVAILTATLMSIAFADPWITDGSTATARYNLVIPAAYTLTSSGTVSVEQLTSTDDANITDNLYVADVYASGTVQGEQLTSTDDLSVPDDSNFGDKVNVGGIATLSSLVVNLTSDFNGAITAADITLDANKNITQSGTATYTGVTGTYSGTVQAEQLTSTDDANITDNLYVADVYASGVIQAEQLTSTDDVRVVGTTTTDLLVVNTTTAQNGPLTLDDALVRSPYAPSTNTSTTDGNAPGLWFVGNASANQTITLPTAANSSGYTMTFVIDIDPGSYNVVIDGKNSEKINGADTKTNSDQYSVLEVTCDGTAWYITDSIGTWT